jgi:S1-C subfamily serine protease/Tfp pilus assembly protein PilF
MKYALLIGCTTALVCFAHPAIAKTSVEIKEIARSVTVEMITGTGSGVILHRRGDLYTLVTNRHVVCGSSRCNESRLRDRYNLKTADGRVHEVPKHKIRLLKDAVGKLLDLAIVQFHSNHSYPVAKVANSDDLQGEQMLYTSGFPRESGFNFAEGQVVAAIGKRLTGDGGGYTIIYDAETLPGMSGGGVFNQDGRLVAVHGMGDRFTANTQAEEVSSTGNTVILGADVGTKIGLNRGIPVGWVVQSLAEQGVKIGDNQPSSQISAIRPATADEFFIAGFNKLVEPGSDVLAGKQQAIANFDRAIELNPRYTIAYFARAFVQNQVQAYRQALNDYDRAINLNPRYVNAYINRALLKKNQFRDYQGALADYDQAIAITPKHAKVYNNRGLLKQNQLNDFPGALADYNTAIFLDPKYAIAYVNRGLLKTEKLNDFPGALADYNTAVALDPKYPTAYLNRGLLKAEILRDFPGALADYDTTISLNPKDANAHGARGLLRYTNLNDRPGGIADMRQAAKLAREQGNTQILQLTIRFLKSWGVDE